MAPSPITNAARMQHVLEFIQTSSTDYTGSLLPYIHIVSVDDDEPTHTKPPRAVLGYTVQSEHCNSMDNMHGGAVATLFDFATSLLLMLSPSALAAMPTMDTTGDDFDAGVVLTILQHLGVSRNLNVTYVRPAASGTDVLIECEMVHSGRQLSSLRGIMRRCSDGAVLSTCEHQKVKMPDFKSSKM